MEVLLTLLKDNPDMVVGVVKEYIDKYKPAVYEMLGEVVKILEDYSNADNYFAVSAKTNKKKFDAYVAAGFSEEQAMCLLLNSKVGLSESMKNLNVNTKSK